VKGLEPEIQRIIEKNKDELRKADERHAQVVREMKEAVLIEHDNKVQELRTRLLSEKEASLDAEREKNQGKLHEQYQRLESQFNDERMRWKSNVYGEYDRIEALRRRENEALEAQLAALKAKQGDAVE
jgi:5-azacytidine-induced protein 1